VRGTGDDGNGHVYPPLLDLDWQLFAACDDLSLEESDRIFFPDRGGSVRTARLICSCCTVKDDCLAFALERPGEAEFGVWGGTTSEERKVLRKQFGRTEGAYVVG
jgi:WhiB family redox-sensing transcriptional regulator